MLNMFFIHSAYEASVGCVASPETIFRRAKFTLKIHVALQCSKTCKHVRLCLCVHFLFCFVFFKIQKKENRKNCFLSNNVCV